MTDGQFPGNDSEVWFQHASDIWAAFPDLVPGLGVVAGITAEANVDAQVERFTTRAAERLIGENVSTFATLPLDTILGNQGAIALLQAKGYTVETPE